MKFSYREGLLALVTAAIVLFGGSALLARSRIEKWKDLRQKQDDIRGQIEQDRSLVAEHEQWAKQLAELSVLLPVHPAGKKTDVYWLSVMDNLATKHGVQITKRQAGEEKKMGDVYELVIECREWEASLDAMVHFLFDLQAEGAMFDVRQLLIKPTGTGLLRGRFSLYCAYTRETRKGG
jgi:hypothetical protein